MEKEARKQDLKRRRMEIVQQREELRSERAKIDIELDFINGKYDDSWEERYTQSWCVKDKMEMKEFIKKLKERCEEDEYEIFTDCHDDKGSMGKRELFKIIDELEKANGGSS